MAITSRFLTMIALQLSVPAAVYFFIGLYNGNVELEGLLVNYLYMAAPHLLVSLLAIRPQARSSALLLGLSLLNLLLIAFALWVLFTVPIGESGFAWILYIPLWGLSLSVSLLVWVVTRYSGPMPKGGAGSSVGT